MEFVLPARCCRHSPCRRKDRHRRSEVGGESPSEKMPAQPGRAEARWRAMRASSFAKATRDDSSLLVQYVSTTDPRLLGGVEVIHSSFSRFTQESVRVLA